MLIRIAPALFVLLWSTGFIGTKMGALGAEPFTFLTYRFVLVLAVLVPVSWLFKSPKLIPAQRGHAMVVGILMNTAYLGGVMWALRHGMASNVSALIVSLQPILTAILAGVLLGEVITRRHWAGLALGLIGTGCVVAPKIMAAAGGDTTSSGPYIAATLALFAITCGTIYQRRFATGIDLLSGAIWQFTGALIVIVPLALTFETGRIDWTPGVIGALVWLVFVLSIGATGLLMLLLRENAVSRTTALFYLVPGVTAVMSYLMFGEQLTPIQLLGLVIVSIAVVLMQPTTKVAATA
jgi:drug/metabolite transporter (DMT)-like permease